MSKLKHTPGPWVAEGMNGVGGMVATYATPEGELKVITRDIHGRTDDELRANTRLIAAAPELLAALETMISASREPRGFMDNRRKSTGEFDNAVKIACAAITKATGVQQ